ncbi:MAG: tripartite tricarboxylate transporter substrate binding protein [Proteobacteria bacterium]|nr:tripartite tricarboxylate transporter substrate binding protein [Burkholderiales bacterium]
MSRPVDCPCVVRTVAVSGVSIGAALMSALAGPGAFAQAGGAAFPVKPIRIIAPFAAGGPVDVTARILAQRLGEAWGQQVVVDNRSGASGMIGTEVVARSAPDGYTALVSASIHVITPALFPKMSYDPLRDLAPVTVVSTSPLLLVVTPSLPAKSVKDFVALAKKRPGELSFGSSGAGSSTHLTAELFGSVTGTKVVHVPYKGQAQALADLMAGYIPFMFNSLPPVVELVKANRLRALAITAEQRSPLLPDVPTVAEAGFKDMVTGTWYGLWLPAKTPESIVARYATEVQRIVALPDVRERIVQLGGTPVASSPAEFDRFQRDESKRWAQVVRDSGAKAE